MSGASEMDDSGTRMVIGWRKFLGVDGGGEGDGRLRECWYNICFCQPHMISNTSDGVTMSLRVCGRAAWVVVLGLLLTGCGDVYRPTIIPNTVPTPDPENFHTAFSANLNGGANQGTTMQVDVAGDSNAGVTTVGVMPVHLAVQPVLAGQATRIWSANPGSDSVSTFVGAASTGSLGAVATVNLPVGSHPLFVHSTEAGNMYVANSFLGAIDPNTQTQPNGNVMVIGATTLAITGTIPVGLTPWAMAETPNGKKLYVANRDDNTISSINSVDETVVATIPLSGSPQWIVARGDSNRVYAVTADGNLVGIDSEYTSALQDQLAYTPPLPVGVANFMYYDQALTRLYIPVPATSSVGIYDATKDPPALMTTISLTAVPPGGGSAPCPASGCTPVSVTSLSDGSRAYIASYFVDSNPSDCTQMLSSPPVPCIASQVTVVNERNNTVSKAISLPLAPVSSTGNCAAARFRISAAASADNSRVYVSNCDGGWVSIVKTSGDSFVLNLPTPASLFPTALASVRGVVQSGSSSTYSYTLTSGTPLWVGMTISVSGIQNPGDTTLNPDNGTFVVKALGTGTFTVTNSSGVSTTAAQSATAVGQPPPQNPVFVVAGP